jgi:hypothetical protein
MAGFIPLYVFLFILAVLGIWAVYRVLGAPSKLPPADYRTVLDDLLQTVERERGRLLAALEASVKPASQSPSHLAGEGPGDLQSPSPLAGEGWGGGNLPAVAESSRKIFQTGYYQALRLKPAAADDSTANVRDHIRRACEACDWAGRMVGGEAANNPLLLKSARSLLEAAATELDQARAGLTP